MFFSDHNPPHFHVKYQGYEATVDIVTGTMKGHLPRRALNMVYEWLDQHKEELLANWKKMEECEPFDKISPLEQYMMDTEFLHVTDAEYVSGYLLKLTFSNGEVRTFDFSSVYDKGIFMKLQDPEYFRDFTLDGWTVDWNNEIGFAPEYLYENGSVAAQVYPLRIQQQRLPF